MQIYHLTQIYLTFSCPLIGGVFLSFQVIVLIVSTVISADSHLSLELCNVEQGNWKQQIEDEDTQIHDPMIC